VRSSAGAGSGCRQNGRPPAPRQINVAPPPALILDTLEQHPGQSRHWLDRPNPHLAAARSAHNMLAEHGPLPCLCCAEFSGGTKAGLFRIARIVRARRAHPIGTALRRGQASRGAEPIFTRSFGRFRPAVASVLLTARMARFVLGFTKRSPETVPIMLAVLRRILPRAVMFLGMIAAAAWISLLGYDELVALVASP
jgi:hypothetical protein